MSPHTAQSIYEKAEQHAREGNAPAMLLILTPAGLSIQTNVNSSFGLGMLGMAQSTMQEMFKREYIASQESNPDFFASLVDLSQDDSDGPTIV